MTSLDAMRSEIRLHMALGGQQTEDFLLSLQDGSSKIVVNPTRAARWRTAFLYRIPF
nr:GntR family transcriptional regulator [Pseudorhizobium flavum]